MRMVSVERRWVMIEVHVLVNALVNVFWLCVA